jgi:hypothetical protein
MENVYLMDQIAVISAGRVIFQGPPESARARFGVTRLSGLYDALQTIDPKLLHSVPSPPLPENLEPAEKRIPSAKGKQAFALPILLQRQFTIFRSDLKNLLIVIGQPLIIGVLVCWVSSNPPLAQFFAYIATLWFGCSNSAQEIVKEVPIYRRERLVGLSRWSYLLSKFLWMGTLTNLHHYRGTRLAAGNRLAAGRTFLAWVCGDRYRPDYFRDRAFGLASCNVSTSYSDPADLVFRIFGSNRRHEPASATR